MKHNPKSQKKMSSFHLKQQFISLLSSEFEKCGFDIILGFESNFRRRLCTLKFGDSKQVEVRINIEYVNKSINIVGFSMKLKICYCALFIADYIKQINWAKSNVPKSYFEGLAFLNAIEVCKEGKTVSIYSPLSHWDKKPKNKFCIRPIEIRSAINALNRLRFIFPSCLDEQDKVAIKTLSDSLLLYSGLPEIAYVHSSIPVYTLVDSFRRLADIIAKDPETVHEFPVLTLAPFDQIEQMTIGSLFLSCVHSDNDFLIGVAIRLIAFFQFPYNLEINNINMEKLVDAMISYIDYSIIYYNELSKCGRFLINDNMFAIKVAVKSINKFLSMYGSIMPARNIHTTV